LYDPSIPLKIDPFGPMKDIVRNYLTESVLGKFRACCLPWK